MSPPVKRGAPVGHRGDPQVLDKLDEIIHVTAESYPRCKNALGSPVRVEKRIIFNIPPPQKIKVIEYDMDVKSVPVECNQ